MFSAFDRYAGFTDLSALNDFSEKPLRKSVRVNTIKTSIDKFLEYGKEKKWKLERVPWSTEAFFLDREDRTQALGTDVLHLLGHFYMQEAASMLPPELLQPVPGDVVLDMSAAPGSKTSQMGAKMQGRGVIVANDIQEKRLWTLKSALHRSGVHNNIVTKKVGQWFAKHMTERFDRVLCDAPCSAQGTIRKDSDALNYCSMDNIEKMARLQFQLLESAIHAAKVNGRIVYSTCTLTPEENELVILQILDRFRDQVTILNPEDLGLGTWDIGKAIEDSHRVQHSLRSEVLGPKSEVPLLRLWPQTYDTEGFFCAVIHKKAPTRDVSKMEMMQFQERPLTRKNKDQIHEQLVERYGAQFLDDNDRLFERGGESLILSTDEVTAYELPLENYALGMPFGKKLKDGRVLIDHEFATLRGHRATKNRFDISDQQLEDLLGAKDIDCPADLNGHTLLMCKDFCVGLGLAKNGRLKNNLPRWMVKYN